MVSKQTGTIITAVMAVLFGCGGIFTCVSGILGAGSILGRLQYGAPGFGSGVYAGLGATICTSLGFIALPVVFYVVLVANNKQEMPAEPAVEPAAEDAPAQ
jgi:hypothetical protein